MQSKKIIAGAVSLATAFTINTTISNASATDLPKISVNSGNHLVISNGTFSKEDHMVIIKNLAGKAEGAIPADFSVQKDGTINKAVSKINGNELEITKLETLGKLTNKDANIIAETLQKPRKKKGKRKHHRPVSPRGNTADLIPSYMNLIQLALANGDFPTIGLGLLGSWMGTWFAPIGVIPGIALHALVTSSFFIPIIGQVASPLVTSVELAVFPMDIIGATLVGASSLVLVGTALAVYGGKNLSGNPKVKRAATRVANNLKATLPFYGSL